MHMMTMMIIITDTEIIFTAIRNGKETHDLREEDDNLNGLSEMKMNLNVFNEMAGAPKNHFSFGKRVVKG